MRPRSADVESDDGEEEEIFSGDDPDTQQEQESVGKISKGSYVLVRFRAPKSSSKVFHYTGRVVELNVGTEQFVNVNYMRHSSDSFMYPVVGDTQKTAIEDIVQGFKVKDIKRGRNYFDQCFRN